MTYQVMRVLYLLGYAEHLRRDAIERTKGRGLPPTWPDTVRRASARLAFEPEECWKRIQRVCSMADEEFEHG